MSTQFAKIDRLAADDFAEIAETCEAVMRVSGTFEESGIACIADGSMYSPSTRVFKGGTHAYHIDDEGASLEAYHETLDRLCDEWSRLHIAHLYWEEGCLWLQRDDIDDIDDDRPAFLSIPETGLRADR